KNSIVVFIALVMVFGFTATAMAEVTLHGSARFFTYSVDSDKEWTGTAYDDTDTLWAMGALSRFGAKFSAGDVGGMWEMDARNSGTYPWGSGGYNGLVSDTSGLGSLRMRHLYGTWNFGGGQLLIGQTWPVANVFTTNLNYTTNGLQFWGGVGALSARTTQIRLTFGDFMVGLLTPYTTGGGVTGYATDYDVTLPKVELRYDLKMQMANIAFIAGYQTYEAVNATDVSKDIDAYTLAIAPQFNFGPAYLNLCLSYNQNPGNYGLSPASSLTYDSAYLSGTEVEDMKGYGAEVALGYKVSDMVTLEAGYSKASYDGNVAGGDREDESQSYYAQVKLTMAPGVFIVPEFAVFDKEDKKAGGGAAATEDGKQTVFGIWWCINFK
ncbi:MAG: hypothetical protein H8D56_24130, partial [Planctomycetes bacterium]|nr:hypothetical protein [Planctomycetota bacterium]